LCTQARGIRNQLHPTKLRLTYFADKSLVLDLQYKNEQDWENCFSLGDVKIPSVAYLGFSAETGELSDDHDVISVATKNLYAPAGGATGDGKEKTKGGKSWSKGKANKKEGGGWGWFFFKFVIFGLVVTGAYVGFTAYRTQKLKARRF
jgi:mannose-binding lectin 2